MAIVYALIALAAAAFSVACRAFAHARVMALGLPPAAAWWIVVGLVLVLGIPTTKPKRRHHRTW